MSKFHASLAVIAMLSLAASATPSFAKGMNWEGGVPRCESTNVMQAKLMLAAELHLSEKLGATIDDWNGCLKVSYFENGGNVSTTFYDPDSFMIKMAAKMAAKHRK